jgi:ATP-binding cassette subfamily B protein RaxB
MTGDFTAGALIAFLAYKDQFDTRATGLIDKFFDFKLLRVQTERLADIVLEEAEPMPASKAAETKWENLAPSIEVRNVSFQYMDGEPLVLRDVSMKIEAGESVAIVGPSGSGKSTLANVILGVLAPTEGEVLVGGVSMREAGVGALRRMIGTVMQDDVLLAGSIGDNISFFDPQGDRNRIEACARLASIHDDIMAMPMQYDTLVGDMGTVLSGGQKQRVLLARALYKKPSILVLDEATSALDVEREAEVNQAIRDMKITRIIIAHRPETIRSADRAILLVGGEVLDPDTLAMLEAGTHPEDSAAP